MWEGCSTCTFLGHVPRDSFIINLQKDSEICAYNKHSWPFFMKMGVLGHHLGISWHGINLFPPHCFQSLNLLQLSTPWKLQHTRFPCASLSPRVCSNTCSLSQWCHPTISCSCPLLLLPSIFPSIRVFSSELALPIRWPKYWSFSFSPSMNIQGWFPLGLTCLICLQSRGLLWLFSSLSTTELTLMNCGAGEDPWESLRLQ